MPTEGERTSRGKVGSIFISTRRQTVGICGKVDRSPFSLLSLSDADYDCPPFVVGACWVGIGLGGVGSGSTMPLPFSGYFVTLGSLDKCPGCPSSLAPRPTLPCPPLPALTPLRSHPSTSSFFTPASRSLRSISLGRKSSLRPSAIGR